MRVTELRRPTMRAVVVVLSMFAGSARVELPSANRVIPARCSRVEQIAQGYLTERGFRRACPTCQGLETRRLEDADGRRIRGVEGILARYVEPSPHYKRSFGVWMAHTEPTTKAQVAFHTVPQGCDARLRFVYGWYSTEWLLLIPVDGDPESRASNLLLENSYLERIASRARGGP